jgi:acetolactate synthase-1/2/3 large subunit
MAKACQKIVEVLIEGGIDHIFGIPGGGTMPIWDAMFEYKDKLNIILARHEQAAACMADMYGRLTGKPAVLMGQGAFVASNGGFGILESYLYGSPMLVLTDTSDGEISQHGTYQSATGEYGSYDIAAILKGMSKFTTYAVNPEEAVHGVQLAIKHAVTGRPGPACVLMRNKAVIDEVNPALPPRLYPTQKYLYQSQVEPVAEEVQKASRMILDAKNPVIIAGSGVHNAKAYQELEEFASLLGIPITTSYRGKSVIKEVHPLALGMMGNFGQKVANDYIAAADLLIVAACRLSPSDIKYESTQLIDPSRQKIIQFDIDPRSAGWVVPVEMSLVGDIKIVLKRLLDSIKSVTGGKYAEAENRIKSVVKTKQDSSFCEAPELYSNASPVVPQRIIREIEEAADENTLITLDAGNNRLWFAHFFKSKAAGTVFCPGGVAGMGWGPPAALAVKLINPDKPVLSVVGDGGFAMVSHVLSTAVQYQLPVVFLVMNNSCLGMVRNTQMDRIVASKFVETDFAALAQAYKCNGIRITKPEELAPAIRKAFSDNVPTLLDVATDAVEHNSKITS